MGVILEHSLVPHCHQYNPSPKKAFVLGPDWHVLKRPSVSSASLSVTWQFDCKSKWKTKSFGKLETVLCPAEVDANALFKRAPLPTPGADSCGTLAGSSAELSPSPQLSFAETMTAGLNG